MAAHTPTTASTAADQPVLPMDDWVRDPAAPAEPTLLVVDPATRKLCIPVGAIIQTQALCRMDRVPSICMLYSQGRCRQGPNCHQVHADPHVVDMLREQVALRTSCCPEHGEEVTMMSLCETSPDVTAIVIDGHKVPAARISTTNGIRRIANEHNKQRAADPSAPFKGEIVLQRAQICRLHIQGRCRYAEDCNFIHLCRSLCDNGAHPELAQVLTAMAQSTPSKSGRSSAFARNAGTPSSAFIPQMPPSPLFAGMPHSPIAPAEGFLSLDYYGMEESQTTPPDSPAVERRMATPDGPWRHDPYSWQVVSPVRRA